MQQSLVHVTLIVNDYDEAINFYMNSLGFELIEDTYIEEQDKRWVLVAPPGGASAAVLLAQAASDEQSQLVGNQAGGRVFLFLSTDDFWRDYNRYVDAGVKFVSEPTQNEYGTVAVFQDLYGNLWDLLQHADGHRYSQNVL